MSEVHLVYKVFWGSDVLQSSDTANFCMRGTFSFISIVKRKHL
jgi:hypothetical protein